MNDKIKDIVVTLVFLFTIISLFLINVIKKDTDISIAERRKLATMPELTTKAYLMVHILKNSIPMLRINLSKEILLEKLK